MVGKEDVIKAIDAFVSDTTRSKSETADFLEELIEDLETRVDALREEIDDEADRGDGDVGHDSDDD